MVGSSKLKNIEASKILKLEDEINYQKGSFGLQKTPALFPVPSFDIAYID